MLTTYKFGYSYDMATIANLDRVMLVTIMDIGADVINILEDQNTYVIKISIKNIAIRHVSRINDN